MTQPSHGTGVAGLVEGAGAGLIFIGAYVPWVVTFAVLTSVPVRGVDTAYGRILPLIPLLALGLIAWHWYARRARWAHLAILGLGILSIALVMMYAAQVQRNLVRARETLSTSGQLPGSISVRFDVGSYLTLAGGAAMVAGGLLGARENR